MLLTVDIGNTTDKFAVFENGKLITHNNSLITHFSELISRFNFAASQCVFSSVGSDAQNREFVSMIERYCPVMQVNCMTPLPFKNNYKSSAIGIDRLSAVAGAKKIAANNILVIDAGTCITFDYLDENNAYLGGSISPGIKIKYRSLYNFTANLPLIDRMEQVDLCCDTTNDCITAGVVGGTIAEIKQTINNYKERFGEINVVITGGDGKFIFEHLDNGNITYEPNLIFYGLKNIYEFNVRNR